MSLSSFGRRLDLLEIRVRRLARQQSRSRHEHRAWYVQHLRTCGAWMFGDLPKDLLKSFLDQEDMEDTRHYLQTGRRFARLTEPQLKDFWLMTWRAFFLANNDEAADDLCASSAELRLRGIQPPLKDISPKEHEHALLSAANSVKADVVNQRKFMKELDLVRDEMARPKH